MAVHHHVSYPVIAQFPVRTVHAGVEGLCGSRLCVIPVETFAKDGNVQISVAVADDLSNTDAFKLLLLL